MCRTESPCSVRRLRVASSSYPIPCLRNAQPPILTPEARSHLSSTIFLSMKRIAILGSTGSIGRSTLSVVESFPDRFQVVTLAAGRNLELAFEQAQRWHPRVISVAAESHAQNLKMRLKSSGIAGIEVVHGAAGTVRIATHPEVDFVVSAIVGVAGLEATYEAVRAGKTVG